MPGSFDWSSYANKLNTETVEKKQKKVHAPGSGQTITIESVRIDFPLKPYAAQIQMMNKASIFFNTFVVNSCLFTMQQIIRALNRGENALLESPTGRWDQ
ncbi:hypothetical protein EDC96DRAFT_81137 [Choanephora cucurbitarum]|nr:hypothetical protein EDC96DRAFT_81137 [Choanephora cucurbitarum]